VSTVVLLLHGLGFDRYVWDFPTARSSPGSPYSLARFLAAQGVDVVAIDQLGYGSSDHPVGWDARQLTVPAYAGIAHQVVQDLRRSYAHVVVIGHSVGAEITEYEAGRYHDVDAVADLDMCDVGASLEAAHDLLVNDFAGMPDDYGYFGGTPAERLRIMYDMKDADPAVAAQDNRMAPLSPESEMQSASLQPSRHLDQLINVPVFVGFGTADALFPAWCQEAQPALYVRSPLVTRFELAGAGHAIMLHRNAGQLENALERWIVRSVPGSVPGG
jgi:pimeloyl-ACP methyl ester carboxylesterase